MSDFDVNNVEMCLCTKVDNEKEKGWYSVQTYYDGMVFRCMHCGRLLRTK